MIQHFSPLSKFRVLDMTNVLAGPFCCHQLAHMGAEVIKIEVPGKGDLARQLGADAQLNASYMGVSFLAQNAGKKSVTINLKKPAGKALFLEILKQCDVLVENFRPGVMKRLGLGYDELKKQSPSLIYCAISGFGQDGQLHDLPAYDQIIQGMSGVMSITGDADTAPYRVGYPISDTIGGLTAAFAISAALAGRNATTQAGCFIDISMLESTMATMGWVISNLLVAGQPPMALGNQNVTACPSGTFKTAEGLLNIAANKQEQFESLCEVLGCCELKSDDRFINRQRRLANRQQLNHELERLLGSHSASYWQQKLNQAGVPSGPVLSVADALKHPQIKARGMIGKFKNVPGVGRDIDLVRTAVKINRQPLKVTSPPPRLGEHTEQVLREMGVTEKQINQYRKQGVI